MWIKNHTTLRRTEAVFAGLALLAATRITYVAWMTVGGEWASHERLIYALSTPQPGWEHWDLTGARTETHVANTMCSWFVVTGWTAAVWLAGRSKGKIIRTLWLFTALLGVVACVGVGDFIAPGIMMAAILAAWFAIGWTSKKIPTLKPVLTAGALGTLTYFGAWAMWPTSFPGTGVGIAAHIAPYAIVTAVMTLAATVITRATRTKPTIGGTVIAAIFAAAWYTGPGSTGFSKTWSTRRAEVVRWTESSGWKKLRQDFSENRMSETEASVQRRPRPEVDTLWSRRGALTQQSTSLGNEGNVLAGWLMTDEAIYSGKTDAERSRLNTVAMTRLAESQAGPLTSEMTGWLQLDRRNYADATASFSNALELQPAAPMPWLGLALAEIGASHDEQAVDALVRWCIIEPRAIFSPAWNRPPLARLRPESMRRWNEAVKRLASDEALSTNDTARLQRFAGWLSAWERTEGNVGKFLNDAEAPEPTAGAVLMVRERMKNTLNNPTDAKIGAIISASTTLLANRHVNLGQCHEIFDAILAGKTGTPDTKATIRISRPIMLGWHEACRITEGGAGATPHDFEENLVVRLLTYGHESSYIRVPDKFLRDALPR